MTITIEYSLVRIYNSYGDPAGVGFAIAPGRLLTCAHVVISALELPMDTIAVPSDVIHFDLPLAKSDSNEIEQPGNALVASWDIKNDFAVLEIIGEPHAKLKPVKLASSTSDVWEHRFSTFGFPKNNDQGIWAMGILLKKNAYGWIQIQDANDVKGYFVQPGFSGAPVWDETLKAVVGMTIAADNDEKRRVAYIIPVESLPAVPSGAAIESSSSDGSGRLSVFLCHSSNDKPLVRDVYRKLANEDWIDAWLDEEKILPGQDWDLEIEQAVESADAVIVFLSTGSITKEGYVQRELKFVLDIAQEKPESTIFIVPVRLDDCKPPRRLRTWQYVDFFPLEHLEQGYQRLLKSLQIRYEQKFHRQMVTPDTARETPQGDKPNKPTEEHPLPLQMRNKVIPTQQEVTVQPWSGLNIPSVYSFVGELGSISPHFYRKKDRHLAVLFSDTSVTGEAFLIDKYAITCQQYCSFLNELIERKKVETQLKRNQYCAIADDHVLAIDCLDRWKNVSPKEPSWLHAPQPFGITYERESWKPIPESELLPVTLVTWWGARLYSLWAHEDSINTVIDTFAYLPTPEQWIAAAQWDVKTHTRRRYPWGDNWNYLIVNFSGFHSGRNVTTQNWEALWAGNSLAYSKTRPIPVAEMPQNMSPVGCVQMVGNTWEWTSGVPEERVEVKGGCATSPMEYCDPIWESRWVADTTQEYVGFRCCYSIRRYT